MMIKLTKIHLLLAACLLIFATAALAVPNYINYQGVLRDSSGDLVTGNRSMVFTIYDQATGGTNLWSVTSSEVAVSNGLYTIQLTGITSSVLGSGDRWLEVAVAGTALTPRLRIASVAYAVTASSAEVAATLGGYSAAASGNNIIPVTDGSGKLDSAVIPAGSSHASTADYAAVSGTATNAGYATVSGTATNAGTVDNLSASSTATANQLLALDSNSRFAGMAISAEASGNNYALWVNSGKIGARTGSNLSCGVGVVSNASKSVTISNTKVTANSLILLTVGHAASVAGSNTNGGIRIQTVNAGTDFTVGTMNGANASGDIPFSYVIIN